MSASGRARDFESAEAMREQNEAALHVGVRRLHRLGLPDRQIAAQLRVGHRKVVAVRKALGLQRNTGGAS
ncbi:MAG TPA: hypothetical protein VNA24_03935 [Hyalangium sp.]|jgi:hypothetical protein|nr:hypothetical protein [Hyalangium sp.]